MKLVKQRADSIRGGDSMSAEMLAMSAGLDAIYDAMDKPARCPRHPDRDAFAVYGEDRVMCSECYAEWLGAPGGAI